MINTKITIPVFTVLSILFLTSLNSEDRNFSVQYYTFLGSTSPIPSKDWVFVKYSLNAQGKIEGKQKIGSHVDSLLITAGSSRPTDWKRKIFRKNFKHSLNELFRKHPGLESIQLDFEFFPGRYAEDFAEFSCSTRDLLRQISPGKRLSLALFPPNHPDNRGFHNWNLLKDCADEFYVMMYDRHNPRTGPGTVTDSEWIESNLNLIKQQVEKNREDKNKKDIFSKTYLGLPLYGYSWDSNGKYKKTYTFRSIPQTKTSKQHILIIPPKKSVSSSKKIQVQNNETIYISTQAFNAYWKNQALKKGMKGIIFWRHGFE